MFIPLLLLLLFPLASFFASFLPFLKVDFPAFIKTFLLLPSFSLAVFTTLFFIALRPLFLANLRSS